MRIRDAALAVLIAIVWGLAFVAAKLALESFSAPELTAYRFIVAGLPALVVPRPKISWPALLSIGLTLFTGQFILLFLAIKLGLPPGVASITQQMQAFFTVLLAAIFLGERTNPRQRFGMGLALPGLVLIASAGGADLTWGGLCLGLASALSWAVGNILLKRHAGLPMLPLVIWLSLVPPLPALALAAAQGDEPLAHLLQASTISLGAAIYLGAVATLSAYAIWGTLLARYSTAKLMPFALLAPCAGVAGSWLAFEEAGTPTRYVGMALILAGVGVSVRRRG